ncbi:GGDEF domain-containing protein [Proteobacteria bacterium 005FR1]|nr:GGDEF domain-containing protein [Proteobacteria bacterium 005FR1]
MQSVASDTQQRRNALRALLVLTAPAALALTAFNLRAEAGVLSILSICLVLVSVACLRAITRDVATTKLAWIYLLAVFGNVLPIMAMPAIHSGGASWLTIAPALPYLILPVRLAFPAALGAFASALAAFFIGSVAAPYRLDPILLAHVIVPAAGLFAAAHFYTKKRISAEKQMLREILTDPMTGLWNRKKVIQAFRSERERSLVSETSLSIILIDLDHFKELNDQFGHDAGDSALIFVARLLERRLRKSDILSRIGGEEFAVLLPETRVVEAVALAEDLRCALASTEFYHDGQAIKLTLSAGIAELGRDGDDWPELYRAVDAHLYASKRAGRNRVSGDLGSSPLPSVEGTA